MIDFDFSIKQDWKRVDFTLSLPEIQPGFVCTSNIRPSWLTSISSSLGAIQLEEGEFHEEFKKDCQKIVDYVNADHQDFEDSMNAALLKVLNEHIGKFGRLMFKDLLLYIDCWAYILNNTTLTLEDTHTAYSFVLASICQKKSDDIMIQHLFTTIPLSSTKAFDEILRNGKPKINKKINPHGLQLINDIIKGFENRFGWYTDNGDYKFEEENTVAKFVDAYFKGNFCNRYMFFPNEAGEIESIAIYGSVLKSHYDTISTTMMCFGFKVKRIFFDTEGQNPFIDIYLV